MGTSDNTLSITQNGRKGKLPRLPFLNMKNEVLGPAYELSLVFTTPEHTHELNKTHRGKDYPTDILSFPLSENSGEIFIDMETAKTEAAKFGRELENFIGFLFIHGLFHLKGLDHGSTMEKAEKEVREVFGI